MALLRLVAQLHPHRLAVIDDRDRFSYRQLWQQAESLALTLQRDYGIQRQQKVAIACRNHATAPSIDQLSSIPQSTNRQLKTVKTGNIVVMTGGTTGQPKPASRKPSVLNFLPPFIALLEQVNLDDYRSLYIATPIYHGFGLAALLIGMVLGGELYVTRRFEAAQACALIATHQIEVVTLVPLMLQRMLKHNSSSLSSLQRILSGGAALSPAIAEFGQRLQAVVIKKPHTGLNEVMLRDWLKPRVARYQMPALIEFRNNLPYTALGKPDKKALRDRGSS